MELNNLSESGSTVYWSPAVHRDLLGDAEKGDPDDSFVPKAKV